MTLKIVKNENEEPKFKPVTIQLTFNEKEDLRSFLEWACDKGEELIPSAVYAEIDKRLD